MTKNPPVDPADEDLKHRVSLFLAGRHVLSLRGLEIDARGGTVTLRGRVGSFYEKQLSQQCCRRVAGVIDLVDRVEVTETPVRRGRLARESD
jgi:osmotically-inducible protein OsmY